MPRKTSCEQPVGRQGRGGRGRGDQRGVSVTRDRRFESDLNTDFPQAVSAVRDLPRLRKGIELSNVTPLTA